MRIIRTLILYGDLGRFHITEEKFTSNVKAIVQIQGDVLILEPVTNCCGCTSTSDKETVHHFPERLSYDIKYLEVIGSGCFRVQNNLVDKTQLRLKVSGSGSIVIYETFLKNVSIKVVGSGSVKSQLNTRVETFDANLIGSGKIQGFNVMKDSNLSVIGSGKIACSLSRDCILKEKKEGSGKIKIDYF